MSVKRKRRSAGETRALVVATAAAELAAGSGALEMASLAKKAGLSEGLAYHYFKNRAGVIAAVVDDFYDRFEERVIDIRFDGDTWQEREKQRVDALVEFYCEDPLTPVIFTRLGSEAEVVEVESRRAARQVDLAEENIRLAQAAGDISKHRDARLLGAMMLGGIRWAVLSALQDRHDLNKKHLKIEIWNAVGALSKS